MSLTQFKGLRKKLNFLTYDLEWDPDTYEERLVGCYDEESGYRSYPNTTEFLRAELCRNNRGKTFFAHAGGLADVQFVLRAMLERANPLFRLDGHWSGSSLVICRITAGKNAWTFSDSYWLLGDSLAKIGKSLGLDKGGSDYYCPDFPACGHPCEGGEAPRPTCIFHAPIGILKDYNALDCRILYAAIDRFQDEIVGLGGEMRSTIASTALMLFRCAHLTRDIDTSPALNKLCRQGYVASRVEVLGRECHSAGYYDVNSSFPWSMTKVLPGKYLGERTTWNEGDGLSIIEADVVVPDDEYAPPLPVKVDSRVYFPTGRFTGRFTDADLVTLLEFGGKVEKVRGVLAFEGFSDLATYVQAIYEMRRTSTDEFERLVLKYLMNSLYGKFGEGEWKMSLLVNPPKRPKCSKDEICAKGCRCVEVYLPGVYKVRKRMEIAHAHVPISAAITASSRALLAQMIRSAHRSGHKSFYCDTDSLVTTMEISPSSELGRLKKEYDLDSGVFLSPKLYRVVAAPSGPAGQKKTTIRAKGFRKLSDADFEAIRRGDVVEIKRMVRIRENFSSGLIDPRGKVVKKRALSHLTPEELEELGLPSSRGVLPKRCFLPDGDTRPYDYRELLGES